MFKHTCTRDTIAAGSTLLPGPVIVRFPVLNEYNPLLMAILCQTCDWGYILFLAAADLVMILRVYAMWNQSKKILAILLFIHVPEIVVSIIWEGVYNDPDGDLSVTVVQLFNHKSCKYLSSDRVPPQAYRAIPRYVLGAALMILSVIPALKQSVEMYKLAKRWQTNRLMKLLAREGAVYFVVNLYFNIVTVVTLPSDGFMTFLNALAYSLSCAIMPRFIISIRESYDRDLLSRQQGIDTGFGLFSTHIANGNAARSAIAFADVTEQSQTLERDAGDSRAIRFDALGDYIEETNEIGAGSSGACGTSVWGSRKYGPPYTKEECPGKDVQRPVDQ
ncbi:hypothetical protein HD554DRAFT_2036980 [Boletus coccyginus]|nr:hypothetical protein HD554DRAFT_2238055 [Boletus coccyginus]KAI9571081.1 hypothetical protein HD554DRAFT_2036980 [Boletus coccyginus]